MVTKNELREAVAESLIEALKAADEHQQPKTPAAYLWKLLGQIIPVLIIALLSWVSITIIDVQRDIALIQKDIILLQNGVLSVTDHLHEHDTNVAERTRQNARIHHIEPEQKCTACHIPESTGDRLKLHEHAEIKSKDKMNR